jgi:hypothetical protein
MNLRSGKKVAQGDNTKTLELNPKENKICEKISHLEGNSSYKSEFSEIHEEQIGEFFRILKFTITTRKLAICDDKNRHRTVSMA